MTIEEIIRKQKEHLTKAQIGELIQATERYKQLNSANRASAMRTLSDQYRATRRGLQNTGLAGRNGKLISGREKAARIRANEAYRQYNAGLRQIDNAYAQNRAARMAYQNAQANQLAETERIQAENDKEVARINAEYEAWLRKKKAAEDEYKRRLEEIERLRAQQQAQQQQIRERIEEDRTEQSGVVQGNRIQRLAKDKHPQLETSDYARAAQEQAVQRAVNGYQQTQKVFRQQREADATYDALHPGSAITRAPHTDDYVIEQKRVENARQLKGSGASDAEVWFADAYGVPASRYKTVKNENPELIKELTGAIQSIRANSDTWDAILNGEDESHQVKGIGTVRTKAYTAAEKNKARTEKASAYRALAIADAAMRIENESVRKLFVMDDAAFDVMYAASLQIYKIRVNQAENLPFDNDRVTGESTTATYNRLMAEAAEAFAPYEAAKRLKDESQEEAFIAGTYGVDETLTPKRPDWLKGSIYSDGHENWVEAHNRGWSADDYEKNADHRVGNYEALVNEWSFINGRTALLYTQNFQVTNDIANIGEWVGHAFGGDINRNEAYRSFRRKCESKMGVSSEKMDSLLTLSNLMTDEERARYNTILRDGGAEEADKYFEYLYESVLPNRFEQFVENELASQTNTPEERLLQSIVSIPNNLIQGVSGTIHTMTTNVDDPVAARLDAKKYTTAQAMRGAVGSHYGEVGNFLYQGVMSMADSTTVALVGQGIGGILKGAGVASGLATKAGSVLGGSLLGATAYTSAYEEAIQRGLSPEKAKQTALANGINEMLFEAVSLDILVGHFQKGGILKVSKNGFVNWVVNTLVSAGVEGSEEVFTDIANRLWDNRINGVFSEELTAVRKYMMEDGLTYKQALQKVNDEFGAQLWESFKAGALSGGVMGGGASFLGMLQGQDVAKIGRNLDDAAKAEIRAHDFQDAEAKEILTGKLTDEDYGRLAMTRLEEMAQTDPVAADKAAQSLIDAMARTDVKVDKRSQTLKTGTENSVSFDYDGVTDVKKMSGVQVEALRFAQTLVKSKVGGVNINVANKLFDQSGNEQNGWYDAKTNTVHVSLNGSQSVVYTISHELTHRLKSGNEEAYASMRDAMKSELESLDLTGSDLPGDYENILGDYLVKDGEQRSAWEALIDYEMDRYAKHGITLDRESAEEEVVCRACETMLERSRLISSMISKNVRGAKTIAKFLASIYDDIASLKEEAESRGYVDGSPEKLFIDQYTDVEKIANAWANAMRTVSQDTTKKIVKEEGRGGTAFSLKQELRDDGQSLADKSMKYRKAHKAESQHISDEMLEAANKQIHRMAQRMLPFLTLKNKKGMTYLPDEVLGKTRFGNSSYGGTSIENTTICFRTLAYIDFTNEIKKQIGRPLTVSESFLASQMLYQIAKEPQCLYCYVSLDRKAYDEQLLSYIKQRDKVVEGFNKLSLEDRQAITKATRNPSKAFGVDIPLFTEFLAKRKDTPQMRTRFAQWIDIANSGSEAITAADLATDERRGLMRSGDDWQETKRTAGKVSLQDQVIDAERYAQSASWAKKMEEYRAYNGDILKIGKRTVNKLNNEYGLRFYSFSEYSPAFIVENMQQIRDAALKGLMGLAYTKKTDFARIFAGTGMNINVSTFGRWGVDADGNRVVVMDSDQGADWTEVQNLRKQYENVGAVFVATDDAMTEWAIKQDWIDVVIPFHIVRTGANVAEFYKWVVHNSEQNDVTAEGKNATIPAAEHGNSYEKYMSLVNERGLTPRFDKWRPENNPNVTADEYMKLVNETRRTLDATKPLQPIYDTREAARSFAAFVHDGGYYGDYYKAKSEQDIKVPVTPEQDILGIGSKTYTEQEGIDRVVADIKAGNKANQVPYGRQDIDEQISRLNKARQVKQHGQKFSLKESSKLSVTPMSNDVSSEMNTKFSIREEAAPTKTQDVYKLMRLGKDGRLYPLFIDSAEGIDVGVWYNADSPDMSDLKTLPSGVYLIGNDGKDIVTLADYQRTHGEKASKFPSKSAINSAATDGKRWVFIEDVAKGQRRYGGENRKYWNLGINGSGSVSTFAMRPGWHAGSLPTMRQIGKGANRNLRDDTFVWVKGRVSADVDYQAEASQNPDNDIPTHIPTNGFYMKATNPNATAAQTDTVGWYIAGAFIADRIIGDTEAKSVIDKWNESHPSDHVEYDWERENGGEFDAETMSIRNAKYSLKESDAQYMDLARRYESGDASVEAELRKAVYEAAERNGYVYKRHTSKKHRSYNDVPWQAFAKGLDTDLDHYGRYEYVATANGAIDIADIMEDMHRIATEFYGNDVSDEEINPSDIVDSEGVWDDPDFVQYAWDNYFADMYEKTDRVPAIVTSDGMIVLDEDNRRVKSADLIERDNDGNIIPLSERFNKKNDDIRYSLKEGEERAVKIADGKTKDGATVSFIDRILDGQKTGETRTSKGSIKPNAWVGIYKDGKVYGRVKFGDPKWITKQDAEYKTSYIKDTNYDIDDSVGGKWYYPVLEVQDFRDNPISTNRAGQWGAAYNLPKNENTRYSLKDTVEGESLGKDYLKYLQLGAKVVNQTATEDEIRDFKRRMNALSQDNREAFLDKLREKLIRDDEGAKVREVRDRQIARLKQEFRESREKMKEARIRRDIITVLKKGNDRIVKMLANPTENSHVPVQLAQTVSEYAIALNDILTKSEPRTGENAGKEKQTQKGRLNFNKLIRVYNQTFADQDTIEQAARENPGFDPRGKYLDVTQKDESLVQMLNDMNEIVQDKRLSDLDSYELQMLLSTMRGVIHTVQEANKQIVRGEHIETYKRGDRMTEQIESAPKVWGRAYLNETLDLRRLALIYSGSDENAEFVQLVKELNEGAKERARVDQALTGMFTDLTTKYGKELRGWYGKDAEWIDTGIVRNGKKIEITKGMRVSLAMHVQNSGNMRHITNGGVTIPNRELYRKGKLKDAYAHGNTVALSESEVNEIISHMTEAEKAYVEVANEFFHKRAGYYINRTSLQLLGYAKAIVENYFPIHSDANYLQTNWGDIMRSGSVEGWGSLKERREASNAIYLEDITSVVNRQIRGVALYAGLAIPVRNWRAVLNSTVWSENEDGVWSPRTTVQKALTQRMGSHGMDVLEGFLTDVQETSAVQSTGFDKWLAKVQTNYVKSVLLGNAKVALKQLASIPTANYIIPWKYLLKGMFSGKADTDIMSDYTSLWKLRESNNATEITSIMREQGLEAKMPWLLGWITGMDKWATKRLWKACELMVADEGKYPIGSDAYYKAVGNLWDDVIQQTQPNFTPLQRADMLRGTSLGKGKEIAHSLTLFGTQRMQNGGILIESLFELKNSKGKSVEAQKKARVKFAKAVTSQIVQNVMLVAIGFIVDALRGRMKAWQDDKDKEVTLKSAAKYAGDQFIGNALGSFLGGSEVKDALTVFVKRMVLDEDAYDVELTVPTVETLETMFAFFTSDLPKYIKYMTNDKYTAEEKMRKSHKFTIVLARAAGYATGLPFENAVKDMFNGINPALQDLIDWAKTGELNLWLHQSGKLDKAKTAANYKEWTKAGFSGRDYFYYEKMMSDVKGGREGRIPVLLQSDLTNEQKAMLMRMFDTSGATSDGTKVYAKNGDLVIDFAAPTEKQQALPLPSAEPSEAPNAEPTAEPTATPNPLSEAKQEGVKEAVAKGVPEQTAFDAFLAYQNMGKNKSDDYSRNDDFRAWLFKNVQKPEERAILEYQVIGQASKVEGAITYRDSGTVYRDYTNESWFKLSEHNLSKDGTNKRYEAGKRLEKTGLSVDKTVAIYDALAKYTKKSEWTAYLKKQGLTDEQINIFLWSRGWAK